MKTLAKISTMFLAVAVVAVMQPRAARAATLNIPAALDGTVTHGFSPGPPGTVFDTLDMTASSFTTDLGSWTDMKVDLSVLPGEEIKVDLPAGKTGFLNVSLNYHGTLGVWDKDEDWPHIFQFSGVIGPAPTLTYESVGGRANGNQVFVQAAYSFTSPFSFTGWEADISGPFSSGGNMTYSDVAHHCSFSYEDSVDGGQFVWIVPEPSTLALAWFAFVGLVACVWRRRGR